MPLLLESLLLLLIAFGIGVGIGWLIWAPKAN
jgi:hypothetical protein